MGRAVFLDRDGTINEDAGYISTLDSLKFIPRSVDALRKLQEYFQLFIVTNQSGIGRGLFTEGDFLRFNRVFLELLVHQGVFIKEVYYCPHTSQDGCQCHKPKPYFLLKAQTEFDINLSVSYVIGDHPSDIEMARNAGARGIYVLTGHGIKHRHDLSGSTVDMAVDLFEASRLILSRIDARF